MFQIAFRQNKRALFRLKANSGLARLYIIKDTTKFKNFSKKNELATFYSFDKIRKKLREPQV